MGLSCQTLLGQEQDSSPTVRSLPVPLDGSNQFGLILEGFPRRFYDCAFSTIDEAMQIEFDGSELLIRRLFTPPCGGGFGGDDGLPTFIPISAVLPDQGDLPVPLPVRVEIECPPHLDECPSGPGLPPGLIGEFLVGQVATLECGPEVQSAI